MPIRLVSLLALAAAGPALAAPGGELGTLEIGRYVCEAPDPSGDSRGVRQPDGDFTVLSASSYAAGGATGTYLRTGNLVTMTSGPHNGARLSRETRSFLRVLGPDGQPSPVRCVLVNRNNR